VRGQKGKEKGATVKPAKKTLFSVNVKVEKKKFSLRGGGKKRGRGNAGRS